MQTDIKELNERIQKESAFVDMINMEMHKVIVGQKHMVERLMIGLLSNGHILLEGVPGLAKTLAVNSLANVIDAKFARIQFTPDLLPADLIGTMIYSQKKEEFIVRKGLSLPTSYLLMKSTVLRQRCKAHCWKQCRKGRLPLAIKPIRLKSHSWCWQPRIR